MTGRHLPYLGLLLAAATWPASALNLPDPSSADRRVRYATYDAADVIQLDTVIGIATHVVLEPGERYVKHAFGDADAYDFGIEGHHLFLKPRAEDANTNLILVTDRRSYAFKLKFRDESDSHAVYRLELRYPAREASAALAEADARAEMLARERPATNWQSYSMSGDLALAPLHAWDDGVTTHLQFSAATDLPAIYKVDETGQEILVNHTVSGRVLRLHEVHTHWRLRLGRQVLDIFNAGTATGDELDARTTVPGVERVIKGAVS